jgi:hypothetical protein
MFNVLMPQHLQQRFNGTTAEEIVTSTYDHHHEKNRRHRSNCHALGNAGVSGTDKNKTKKPATSAAAQALAPMPVFSWSGNYAGLNLGGVCDRASADRGAFGTTGFDPINAPDGFIDFPDRIFKLGQYPNFLGGTKCGVIGGAQVGYNFLSDNIVWGAETDLQTTSLRRTDMRFFPPANLPARGGGTGFFAQNTEQASQKMELFGTLRARRHFGDADTSGLCNGRFGLCCAGEHVCHDRHTIHIWNTGFCPATNSQCHSPRHHTGFDWRRRF